MNSDTSLPPVMIVDDDEDDVLLLARQLKAAGVPNPVIKFENGGDAFLHLKQFCEPGAGRRGQVPVAMFLDVNMNGLSGFDVLVWARQQPSLGTMKIFMLSGANEIWDAQIAAKLGADEYLEKFPEPAVFKKLIGSASAVPSA